jgi:hypothetical protein
MTPLSEDRTCTKTGLRLIRVEGDRMFRVAIDRYGALSAVERFEGGDRTEWGRFDSPGFTVYTAQERETAYAEVLAPFKRQLGAVDPLETDASALGMTRNEFLEEVASQWSDRSFMGLGAVPASWRYTRGMYEVYAQPGGWWIDLDHPDTISRLETAMESLLIEENVKVLTTSVLTGHNRRITTTIGELLKRYVLDDHSRARGLQFRSKFGGAWCRAIWLPADADEWNADLVALSSDRILISDEHLARASERFRIRVF